MQAQTKPGQESAVRYVFSKGVFRRSLTIALVVGTILSLTNQLDVMLRGELTAPLIVKIFFNFLIPFGVLNERSAEPA